MEIIQGILGVIYISFGYWSIGQTIYANKIRIGSLSDLFARRLLLGIMLGWILIPVALIKLFILSKQ